MPVTRFRLFIIVVSLLGSVALWALYTAWMPGGGGGGYAALVVDESVPDREIRRRLEAAGLRGVVSESGQWFLLDSFGSMERVPLDQYSTRLLPFDPRNDGYAEKLRSLFVRDGRRIAYIPVDLPTSAGHRARIGVALGDIPFSIEYTGQGSPTGLLLALFCLACLAFVVIPPLRSALRPLACLLPCLPTLAPLCLGGPAGFTLAALLAGFAVSFAETRLDPAVLSPVSRGLSVAPPRRSAPRRLLLLALLAGYGIVVLVSGFSILVAALVLVLFGLVIALSLRSVSGGAAGTGKADKAGKKGPLLSQRYPGHRRFSPVSIVGPRAVSVIFAWAMLPFAVLALALAFTSIAQPHPPPAGGSFLPSAAAVTREDFQNHVLFQSTFSVRPLGTSWDSAVSGMSVYRLTPDGLPELSGNDDDGTRSLFPQGDIPAFPLGGLARELDRVSGRAEQDEPARPTTPPILALLPLLFIVPCLIVRLYFAILKKSF